MRYWTAERDPCSGAAEYGAQFRSDVESFVNRAAVEACVSVGVREHCYAKSHTLHSLIRVGEAPGSRRA
jgi:hypothetical protein